MLDLNDPRWPSLQAGYRQAIDIRPLLVRLENAKDPQPVWDELWQELYHQGDIGEASMIAVPHLLRIHRQRGTVDWNTYALAASIELARRSGKNRDVPNWAREAYQASLLALAQLGLQQLPIASDSETIRSVLAPVATFYGARGQGRLLVDLSDVCN